MHDALAAPGSRAAGHYHLQIGRLIALVLTISAFGCGLTGAMARASSPVDVYSGLGTWLDIFAGAPWSQPDALVARARAAGVTTLYLETSNYSQPTDVVRPAELGKLLDAAHAAGLKVVAWYLPGFTNSSLDARRVLAAIHFRSRSGQTFDGFALDIEASIVKDVALRNERLLSLAQTLRRSVTSAYPLGAIIPSPVGMLRHRNYWPAFPYAALERSFRAFLPMAYFSYYAHTPHAAYGYARDVVELLRAHLGNTTAIHVIGGSARSIPPKTLAGFVRAVSECGAQGISLYAFPQTSAADWATLDSASLNHPVGAACTP